MKTLVISDTHGLHDRWEQLFPIPDDLDMIIHGGDFSNVGRINEMNEFLIWFADLPAKHKIFIAGNHDLGMDTSDFPRTAMLELIDRYDDVHYLQDSGVEIEGIKFWGSPVTPPFMTWAFMRTPDKIKPHWDTIPDDIDVLITHGPMRKVLDYSTYGNEDTGCMVLVDAIKRVKPKYHIFGHIHNMYGKQEHSGVTHINASVIDDRYYPVRAGHVINI